MFGIHETLVLILETPFESVSTRLRRSPDLRYSSVNQKLAGIRFFWREVLRRKDFDLRVPAKRSGRLPEALSRSEIARLFAAATCLKHRALLMTCYAAGLRVSELVQLRLEDIHSQRMLIHVRARSAPSLGRRS